MFSDPTNLPSPSPAVRGTGASASLLPAEALALPSEVSSVRPGLPSAVSGQETLLGEAWVPRQSWALPAFPQSLAPPQCGRARVALTSLACHPSACHLLVLRTPASRGIFPSPVRHHPGKAKPSRWHESQPLNQVPSRSAWCFPNTAFQPGVHPRPPASGAPALAGCPAWSLSGPGAAPSGGSSDPSPGRGHLWPQPLASRALPVFLRTGGDVADWVLGLLNQ